MFFEILTQFGLPVAAAVTMGVFIYIILKYILARCGLRQDTKIR
jgi:hypothetical protein